MKNWKDLTVEELASLTDKELDMHIKLILCNNGVKNIEKPEKPVKPSYDKDCNTVYSITNLSTYLAFTDINEAIETVKFLKSRKTSGRLQYTSGMSVPIFKTEPEKDYHGDCIEIGIMSNKALYEDKELDIKDALDKYKKDKSKYDLELEYYEDYKEKAEEFCKPFMKAREEAVEIMNIRTRLKNIYYKDYLPLAEGNKKLAMNFLKKAYSISEEDEKYINAETK